jgi:uncharacterized protein YfaS (alpha-2-macroglobulin family)/TolA-binding protein
MHARGSVARFGWLALTLFTLVAAAPSGVVAKSFGYRPGWWGGQMPSLIEDEDPVAVPTIVPDAGLTFAKTPDKAFRAAKKDAADQNWKRAAEGFVAFLAARPNDYDACEARALLAQARVNLREYDDALKGLQEALAAKPGSWCAARLELAYATTWEQLPGYGYERDGGISYDLEDRDGQQVSTWERNRRKAFRATERAVLLLVGLADMGEAAWRPLTKRGEDVLDLLRVAAVSWSSRAQAHGEALSDDCAPATPLPPPDVAKALGPWDPTWSARTKALVLFLRVATYDQRARRFGPLGQDLYRRAIFLQQQPVCAPPEWTREREQAEAREAEVQAKRGWGVSRPREPYDAGAEWNPQTLLARAAEVVPGGKAADLYVGTAARIWDAAGHLDHAAAAYQAFLKRFPKSRYAAGVRYRLQEMAHPSMTLDAPSMVVPGAPLSLHLTAANVGRATVSVYRVDLFELVKGAPRLTRGDVALNDLAELLGGPSSLNAALAKAERVARFEHDAHGDAEPWFQISGALDEVKAAEAPGAYVVRVAARGVETARVVIRTELVLLGRVKGARETVAAVDWRRGEPAADVDLLVRETFWRHGWLRDGYDTRVTNGRTNPDGEFVHTFVSGDDVSGSTVQILARKGSSYALLGPQYPNLWQPWREIDGVPKAFTYTDRPVYRPGHTVKWRSVVRLYRDGTYRPAAREAFVARITSPRGVQVKEEVLTTDAFGVIASTLPLEEGADLGAWNITLQRQAGDTWVNQSAGSGFRVEEYKKPEFEVTVTPSASIARLGERLSANVDARTYFGTPVAGATVKYTVYRSIFWSWYCPASRWDWLYGEGYGTLYERPTAPGEELVSEGTGTTDADGRYVVGFDTADGGGYDYSYRVVAEVTDLMRRTIEGAGNVKATRQPFYLHVDQPAGFFTVGDDAEVKVIALNADDVPVKATGSITVARVEHPSATLAPTETLVATGTFEADARGEALYTFRAEAAGEYVLRLEARGTDSAGDAGTGAPVTAEHHLYVAGERFAPSAFRFSSVLLNPEKRDYRPGDDVRVLVGVPGDGARAWLTLEADNEVLDERWVRPDGAGFVWSFPATSKHVPNVYLVALAVVDGQVHRSVREIFVPPVEHLLDVTLTADRAEYLPQQKGRFQVTVKDDNGRPVAGEIGLHAFDASVLYIQRETMGDVRAYFYGARRANMLNDAHSGQLWLTGWQTDASPLKPFEGDEIPLWGWDFGMDGDGEVAGLAAVGRGYGAGGAVMLRSAVASRTMAMEEDSTGEKKEAAIMPMAAPAPAAGAKADANAPPEAAADKDTGGEGGGAVTVRASFPDSLIWEPFLKLDADGKGTVEATFPDSLTRWQGVALAVDDGSRVGIARVQVTTVKNVVARVETPRFLVEGDEATLAAVITNRFDTAEPVTVRLAVEGGAELVGVPEGKGLVTVPAGGDARVDFAVRATKAGPLKVTLTARGQRESDALLKELPVLEYGAVKTVARAAVLKKPGKAALDLAVPADVRPGSPELVVDVAPSLAGVLLGALPYLIEYPYGCVEQTTSRFVPAVLVRKTLADLGVGLDDLKLPPSGRLDALTAGRAPVLTKKQLDRVVADGLQRLVDFQRPDGGWAWWRDGESDPYMTAYVLQGLRAAADAGVAVDDDVLARGAARLERAYRDNRPERTWSLDLHTRAFAAYVLANEGRLKWPDVRSLFEHRGDLSDQAKAMLGLALHRLGQKAEADLVAENLRDLAWVDAATDTASFKDPNDGWWWWYENRVEKVTWALRLFLAVKPGDPMGDRFARWLVQNREGSRWTSTRDTAFAVQALAEHLKASGEQAADANVVLTLDGERLASLRFTAKSLLEGEQRIVVPADKLGSGEHRLEVSLDGRGRAYASAFLTYFTREAHIEGSGYGITVQRRYYRLEAGQAQAQSWHGKITERVWRETELSEGDVLHSGDRLRVRVTITSSNDYEYLVFEDWKPAGAEPLELKSGGLWENGAWWERELRDTRVVSFLSRLPQGTQALQYDLRVEIPGTFHALPHAAHAMYAPRVKAISDSAVLTVQP